MRVRVASLVLFAFILSAAGCGESKLAQERKTAQTHLTVAEGAVEGVTKNLESFGKAVKANSARDAKDALEALKSTVADFKKKADELPKDHPWLTIQETDKNLKHMLGVSESTAIPEMTKIVTQLEAGKSIESDSAMQESMGKIGDSVAPAAAEASRLFNHLKMEIAMKD